MYHIYPTTQKGIIGGICLPMPTYRIVTMEVPMKFRVMLRRGKVRIILPDIGTRQAEALPLRIAWILEISNMLLEEIVWRRERNIPDEGESHRFSDICNSPDWTISDSIEWTYVTDLDNLVFTVNGVFHFKFDNMPPDELSVYFDRREISVPIPRKYLTTSISLWLDPEFDVEEVEERYINLYPIITSPTEWGAPTWDTLPVAQHLSAQLVRALVNDHSYELALDQFPCIQYSIGLFCWRVICAAAPSNLLCPPEDIIPADGVLYATTYYRAPRQISTVPFLVGGEDLLNRYCWFRGCLITFCVRLDDPAHLMNEVNFMVEGLLYSGQAAAVGLIVSSRQMVAVAVNRSGSNPEVRHTPALAFHGDRKLKDGLLLMMHLLSPMLPGVPKTPWGHVSPPEPSNSDAAFPKEVLEKIIQFTDFDTYLNLPLVSRQFRMLCLMRPRVGYYTLLAKEPGPRPIFRVQSTSSATSSRATLARTTPPEPFSWSLKPWESFRGADTTLRPGLGGSFQHRRVGVTQTLPEEISQMVEENTASNRKEVYPVDLGWKAVVGWENLPELRVQAVGGVWCMVKVGSRAAGMHAVRWVLR